jgi:uncharacterized protein YbjT (DUF2867 family)
MASPILVTGGTGTLGRLLVPRLRDAGATVRVLSRRPHVAEHGVEYTIGDLMTGGGLDAAVDGVATFVHCASNYKGDPAATRNLVRAASRAGKPHLVYISIVGVDAAPIRGLARMPFGYLASKLETERIISRSGLPWTTLRATQFYDLIFMGARGLTRSPVVPVPAGMRFQPLDTADVADAMAKLALGEPAGRAPDIGGPQVMTFGDLIGTYMRVAGRRRPILQVPMPGRFARAIRNGALLVPSDATPQRAAGRRTWEEFVSARLG